MIPPAFFSSIWKEDEAGRAMAQFLQVFFILSRGGVTGMNLELEAVDGL